MKKIINTFFKITRDLNIIGVTPIIYGSVGLSLALKKEMTIDDIDYLINKSSDFLKCKKVLLKNGFIQDPAHKRELIRQKLYVSFIDKKSVEILINETLILHKVKLNKSVFYNIDLRQYLKIYENGLKNKFRKQKKEKDDHKKINLIQRYLAKDN